MADTPHKAGFVSIVGKPNVGKSTLMNALVGEKLSIITSKAQTTRHRIMGILNSDDFQIVYSDTPGIIKLFACLIAKNHFNRIVKWGKTKKPAREEQAFACIRRISLFFLFSRSLVNLS